MNQRPMHPARGSILLFALIVSAVIMAVTVSFFNYFGSVVRAERFAVASAQALALAEAGVDQAVYELNQDASYSGESGTALGGGVFTVSVASIDGNTKRLTATGFVPNSESPTATKVIQVTVSINSSLVSFRYGVQIGDGGVTMGNGSVIVGNIFANGDISGGGTITGDATVAVGTDPVANQQWLVQNSGFAVGDTAAHAAVAQEVEPSVNASLTKIRLLLKKAGTPSDLSVKVVSDNNGKPSTTVLASGVIPASLITDVYGFIDVTLDGTPPLVAGQSYWIILIAPVSATNYVTWGRDSNGGYPLGTAKYSSDWNAQNPSWSNISGDLNFMLYVTGVATALSGVTVQGNAWADSLLNCTVGGDATYQTTSSCSVAGTTYPDTVPATPAPLPISDAQIANWEAIAESGGTIPGPYTPPSSVTLGPKKIDGDLIMANGEILILSGPVWVNGNVSFSNNAELSVSPGTGTGGAIIVADATGNTALKGVVSIGNNVEINGNGNENSFPMIVTTNTSTQAIDLANNADSVILYAPYGTVEVSNLAGANQITARHLELGNNSRITYVSGLQNASFSNGPGGSWAVIPGTYAITR